MTRKLRAAVNLASLAGRNVRRHRARSAITLVAIFFGVVATILLSSFGHGLTLLMLDDVIQAKRGGIQVHRKGWAAEEDNQPLSLAMPERGDVLDRVRATPGVAAAAGRLVFGGLVSNGREATMIIGRGVDPAAEYVAMPWATRDIVGAPIAAGDGAATARGILGGDLAQALGIVRGGLVTLQAQSRDGRQNALDLEIGGTLDNVTAFEAKRVGHVPLAFAQSLTGMEGRINEIVVRAHDREAIATVADALRAALGPDYEVVTWREIQPNLADIIQFQRVVIRLIAVVFLVIVVFGVANTMIMSVLERTREIGTMMAVGVDRRLIGTLFLLEAAVLAGLGAGLGWAAARGLVAAITAKGGFLVAAPGQTIARYAMVPIIPPGISATAVVASIAGALLAALYPAWKATRLRPVDALRSV